jgi:hypothetical protein
MTVDHIQHSNIKPFLNSPKAIEKILALPKIADADYRALHRTFLTPTSLSFDVEAFVLEIDRYSSYFTKWGKKYQELPRYGLPLFNVDGCISKTDPTMGSLLDWIKENPDNPILETDCTTATEVYNLKSLEALKHFDSYFCRSSILKWGAGSVFTPHIDVALPAPWFRLWATTSNYIDLSYWDQQGNKRSCDYIEAGRIYLIDTTLVHEAAWNARGWVYQLFLSLMPSSISTLRSVMM